VFDEFKAIQHKKKQEEEVRQKEAEEEKKQQELQKQMAKVDLNEYKPKYG